MDGRTRLYENGSAEPVSGLESQDNSDLVAQFQYDVDMCYDGRIRSLPSFEADLNHVGRIPLLVDKYRRISGVYLNREITDELTKPHVPKIDFASRPIRGFGREDSRRKVFFGDLLLPTNNFRHDLPVAVKAFRPDSFNHAMQEAGMFQYLKSQGIPTLQLLGVVAVHQEDPFVSTASPTTYVLTCEEPAITTLDNTEWATLHEQERWSRVRPAIDTLTLLHTNMLFHGDLRFRNIAHGEAERSNCIVDTEYMVSMRDKATPFENIPDEVDEVVKKMSTDITAVCESVNESVVVPGLSDAEKFEDHLEHILSPYYLAIMRSDSPYRDMLMSAFELVLEQKRQQACGEWSGRSKY